MLPATHKASNPYDHYAIAARKRLVGHVSESVIGHLPKEILRITQFLILYGAVIKDKILHTHYCRSPLVQGGLEISIEVEAKIEYSQKNKTIITKYEALVNQYYKEPVDGAFENITTTALKDIQNIDSDQDSDKDEENLE